MMRHLLASMRFVLGALLIAGVAVGSQGLPTTGVLAQGGDSCEQIVQRALSEATVFCGDVGSGEACLGHARVTATVGQGETAPLFASGGDRVAVASLEALVSSAADIESGDWGLAVIHLPSLDAESQVVTAVVYGDVTLSRPAAPTSDQDRPTLSVYNRGGAEINLRNGAGITYDVIAQLGPGVEAVADGRNEQGDWVRIQTDSGLAWVFTPLIGWDGDQAAIDALTVLLPNDVTPALATGDVQAFSLVTGGTVCAAAPSGLLLQTSDDQPALVTINQTTIAFAQGTLLLTTQPGDSLDVKVLQGGATVTARGISVDVSAGEGANVSLGGDGGLTPTAAPVALRSYPFPDIAYAPLGLLPEASACIVGLPAASADVRLRVGPGTERGELSTMSSSATYAVIGWANDPDGAPWWKLDTGKQSSWAPKDAVRAIGACESVAQVEAPPLVLAPPPAAGDSGAATPDGLDLAPTTNSVWQMHPGTDNMSGQCSGAPAINFCDHLAAITPATGGIAWKGMEANPYYLVRVQPNVYAYSGPNVLGTGTINMTLTFTTDTTVNMTMSLVLSSEPDCQHVYFYTGTRNW